MRSLQIAFALSLTASVITPGQSVRLAAGGPQSEPKLWSTPWDKTRPRDPYADQQGRVWFVGQVGNYIAHLDPKTGAFRKYDIEPNTHPHNLVVDSKGMVWFTGNTK